MVLRRKENSQEFQKQKQIFGFIHNWSLHYTTFTIYEDGIIDCWEAVDIEGFKKKIEEGWVVFPKEGDQFDVEGLLVTVTKNKYALTPEEFIHKIQGIILELNGRKLLVECKDALEAYKLNKTPLNLEILRDAYYLIPADQRMYVGDMDTKDGEVLFYLQNI